MSYRPQWKDDWEILFATIEEHDGEPKLRLTMIERYENPCWKKYALDAGGVAGILSYMYLGDWFVEQGRMGGFPELVGQVAGVLVVGRPIRLYREDAIKRLLGRVRGRAPVTLLSGQPLAASTEFFCLLGCSTHP